jgi:tRNA-specific 2-thiouridylase
MDSLLALALMHEAGHDVLAVHAHFLPPGPDWEQVAAGLSGICAGLGVPFHALDLHREFERMVVAPFAEDYRAGRTPNPCAQCNPRMKFGTLFDAVRGLGAERLATGHYVRLEERDGLGTMLVRGADGLKDQSYFLALVPIDVLRQAVFPLGTVCKQDVPEALARFGLTPPLARESQEICFVPGDDYHRFLIRRGNMPGGGRIVLEDGTVVGRHKGLWRHTQGQRRGLGFGWSEPLYVLDKDVRSNALIVGPKSALDAPGCVAGQVNLMVDTALWPETVMLQTRYRQSAKPARFRYAGERLIFDFLESHGRPTPGQVAVAYTADGAVLGGGIIETIPNP